MSGGLGRKKFAVYTTGKNGRVIPRFNLAGTELRRRYNLMICRYFKVAHRDMVFIKFILEAYEGMNVMSTVDNRAGIIRIAIMPGFVEDMDALLAELGKQVTMEPAEWEGEWLKGEG